MLKGLLAVLLFLLLLHAAAAVEFTVGVSPSVVDLGEVERGTTKIARFYLVTPSDEPLLVLLQTDKADISFFKRDQYKANLPICSEEDATSWVEFLKNPVELTISNESFKTAAGEIKGWRDVTFLLNIPENAEPGYHVVRIKPMPYVPAETIGQAGARVVAITSVSVVFKLAGDVKREGVILDVTPGSYSGNRLELNTYFKNTGTVTIVATGEQKVYNSDGLVETIRLPTLSVAPGETKVFKAYLPLAKIVAGEMYNVSTKIDYTTGYAFKNSTFVVAAYIPPPERVEEFPWLLLILIILIALIAIGIYKWYK